MWTSRTNSSIRIIVSALLSGLIGLFVKFMGDMQAGALVFYRLMIGLALIILYLGTRGRLSTMKLADKKG
jgi:hypothetical protein